MASKVDYGKVFHELLNALPEGGQLSIREILSAEQFVGVRGDTVRKHLKSFIDEDSRNLGKIIGFYPKPETIIALVEKDIGPVCEKNLDDANRACEKIVDGVARPIVNEFIREGLRGNINALSGDVSISIGDLIDFLISDYSEFVKSSGNGLVSIAGSLNELLLITAMKNGGMNTDRDFTRTGKNSKADIVVHSHAGTKENLAVEVKSFHARERLLRGLQDIGVPKIGVGFFKDPSEFNPGRTMTLLQAQPAAIYMPGETLGQVSADAKLIKTTEKAAFGSALYRPLERFVTDMKAFNAGGKLPDYSGTP